MQENGLNKIRTIVYEVSSSAGNSVYSEINGSICRVLNLNCVDNNSICRVLNLNCGDNGSICRVPELNSVPREI